MRLTWLGIITLIILPFFWPGQSLAQETYQPFIVSDQNGLTLTWSPPAYTLNTIQIDGNDYSRLELPLTSLSGQPGYPQLPVYTGLIGLPPGSDANLEVIEIKRETVSLPHLPLPVPLPQPIHLSPADLNPESLVEEWPATYTADPSVYNQNDFYPRNIAALGGLQQLRQQRFTALTIYPLRVNLVTKELEVVRYLNLRIQFSRPAAKASVTSPQLQNPLAQALGATLLNPEATAWPSPPAAALTQPLAAALSTTPVTKIWVNSAGLYALSYSSLQSAGLPVNSLDPRTFTLSHGYPRQEVAILVEGETDGVFNASDRLLFYAEPEFSRYSTTDVYFLSYGGVPGLRMSSRSGNPAGLSAGTAWRTVTAETNQYYEPLYPGRDGDHWFWDKLYQPNQTSRNYNITIDKPLTSGPNSSLTLWLRGYTDPAQNPDHRIRAAVNGATAGEQTWNGTQSVTATFSIASGNLLNGQNQIGLTLPGVGTVVEGTWLDAIALTYPTNQATSGQLIFQGEAGQKKYTLSGWSGTLSVYDITIPSTPKQVTGYQLSSGILTLGDAETTASKYLVVPSTQIKTPVSLQAAKIFNQPANGADYLIITSSSLAGVVTSLATHRANQGLRVATAEVEAIYDTFGTGRTDPAAIKNFLQYAYSNWPAPAPLYVLLVGDGHYDFKNYSGYNAPNLIPPYLAQVDPWWGETASDNQYVTLAGNDNLPDMLIGRLPVNTPTEAATVVNKIIQYETNPAPGAWNGNQLFVADKDDDFHNSVDLLYSQVVSPFIASRFYYSSAAGQPYYYMDVNTLRNNFLSYFNGGASLVTFYGHSSWLQWAVDDILDVDRFNQLTNQSRLPVVVEMTCFTSFFHHPAYANTFDETLVRRSGGGAIATWGSTGLGISTGHDTLYNGFYQALAGQSTARLGAAVLAGKLNLYATGFYLDLLDTYTLLGDPALNLHLTVTPINYTNAVYLPLINR
ncbi:MAG: C25 family cysteine peptidase [Anaerolineae bacterium]